MGGRPLFPEQGFKSVPALALQSTMHGKACSTLALAKKTLSVHSGAKSAVPFVPKFAQSSAGLVIAMARAARAAWTMLSCRSNAQHTTVQAENAHPQKHS